MRLDMAFDDSRGSRLRFIASLTAALITTYNPAAAQTPLPDTPDAYGVVLKNWAARHGVQRAIVVVRREGRVVYRSAVGGADPTAAVHLASLSKAITGACVATLIRDGKLAFEAPAEPAVFAAHGSRPIRASPVTACSCSHRAGFGQSRPRRPSPASTFRYLRSIRDELPKPALLITAFKRSCCTTRPRTRQQYRHLALAPLSRRRPAALSGLPPRGRRRSASAAFRAGLRVIPRLAASGDASPAAARPVAADDQRLRRHRQGDAVAGGQGGRARQPGLVRARHQRAGRRRRERGTGARGATT